MKRAWVLTYLFVALQATAQTTTPLTLDELCAYDRWCKKGTNFDGSFIAPKDKVVKILSELKEPIRIAANEMGVDPRAVAGAILAENSMNVVVDKDVVNFWEKIKASPGANLASKLLRGKSLSLGLGQIKPEAAASAEATLSKIEKRPQYSFSRVSEELENPISSIRYAAAIIRDCQDAYKAKGMDVSQNPGVLATLYNLGNCPSLAAASKSNASQPRPNFFGNFVDRNLKEINSIVDTTRPYTVKEKTDFESSPEKSDPKSNFVESFKRAQPIYPYPPRCRTFLQGLGSDYEKDDNLQTAEPIAKATGDYTILSGGVDCGLDDWSLIRTNDGKTGWVSNKDREKNSAEHLENQGFVHNLFFGDGKGPKCNPRADADCRAKAALAVGADHMLTKPEEKGMPVKLVGPTGEPEKPNVTGFSSMCLNSNLSYGMKPISGAPIIPKEKFAEILSKLQKKQDDAVAQNKWPKWQTEQNGLAPVVSEVEWSLKSCLNSKCSGDLKMYENLLNEDFNSPHGYRSLKKFHENYNRASTVYFAQDSVNLKENAQPKWKAHFDEIQKKCEPLFKVSPNALSAWKTFRAELGVDSATSEMPPFQVQDSLISDCNVIDEALEPKKQTDAQTEAAHCINCVNDQNQYNNGILAQLITPEDSEEFFKDSVNRAKMMFPRKSRQMMGFQCNYNPLASAKRVEDILKLDCVEAVFVPDYFLVNHLKNYAGRVFYKPFDEGDHFNFTVKKSCAGKATK